MTTAKPNTVTHAVVLAGGLGTRIRTELGDTPKALAEIAGKPFVQWKLQEFHRNGIASATFLIGTGADAIISHVSSISQPVHVDFKHDGPELLGTGGALLQAIDSLPDEFILTYGDTLLDMPYIELEDARQLAGTRNAMSVTTAIGSADVPNCRVQGHLVTKHSKVDRVGMTATDYGAMLLTSRDVMDTGFQVGVPLDLAIIIDALAHQEALAAAQTTEAYWEIGTPASLERARTRFS